MEPAAQKLTVTDRVIARVILPLLPKSVTPNQITGARFAVTPFVIYLLAVGSYVWGLVLFVLTAFTDAVDGALARTRGPITEWGKMYDPLADKLLIGSVVALVVSRFISHYLALAIIFLELLIIASAFWLRKYRGREIQAKAVGKVKMILQSFGVGFLMLYTVVGVAPLLEAARYTLYAAVFFAVLSLFVYRSI